VDQLQAKCHHLADDVSICSLKAIPESGRKELVREGRAGSSSFQKELATSARGKSPDKS